MPDDVFSDLSVADQFLVTMRSLGDVYNETPESAGLHATLGAFVAEAITGSAQLAARKLPATKVAASGAWGAGVGAAADLLSVAARDAGFLGWCAFIKSAHAELARGRDVRLLADGVISYETGIKHAETAAGYEAAAVALLEEGGDLVQLATRRTFGYAAEIAKNANYDIKPLQTGVAMHSWKGSDGKTQRAAVVTGRDNWPTEVRAAQVRGQLNHLGDGHYEHNGRIYRHDPKGGGGGSAAAIAAGALGLGAAAAGVAYRARQQREKERAQGKP